MSPRGPYAKGVAKREEILGVALDLFARDGYDKTSFREVARATGLSQAGLLSTTSAVRRSCSSKCYVDATRATRTATTPTTASPDVGRGSGLYRAAQR